MWHEWSSGTFNFGVRRTSQRLIRRRWDSAGSAIRLRRNQDISPANWQLEFHRVAAVIQAQRIRREDHRSAERWIIGRRIAAAKDHSGTTGREGRVGGKGESVAGSIRDD